MNVLKSSHKFDMSHEKKWKIISLQLVTFLILCKGQDYPCKDKKKMKNIN